MAVRLSQCLRANSLSLATIHCRIGRRIVPGWAAQRCPIAVQHDDHEGRSPAAASLFPQVANLLQLWCSTGRRDQHFEGRCPLAQRQSDGLIRAIGRQRHRPERNAAEKGGTAQGWYLFRKLRTAACGAHGQMNIGWIRPSLVVGFTSPSLYFKRLRMPENCQEKPGFSALSHARSAVFWG